MALNRFKKYKVTTAETEELKARVMNNVVTLYNNNFDFYTKTYDESALNEKEGRDPNWFKIADNKLPEWLKSKNDFNKAKRLIDDIEIDINKVKVNKENKNVFNDLNRLITDISQEKLRKEDVVEKLKKSMSNLDQLRKG